MMTYSHSNTIRILLSAALVAGGLGSAAAADAEHGRQIYEQTCVACHGADGKGALPGVPDFTASNGPLAKEDAVLAQNVVNGFQSPGSMMAMPPKGGNAELTEEDIVSVLRYIRGEFGS